MLETTNEPTEAMDVEVLFQKVYKEVCSVLPLGWRDGGSEILGGEVETEPGD